MNGITNASFWVHNKFADKFQDIITSPDDFQEYCSFLEKMKAQGFVIDDETDESVSVKNKYALLRLPNEYLIMILPTYQCNLRCWYCVQEHENSWMSDDDVRRVKDLILKRIENPEIKKLNITWFGGEPLMAYDKVLDITEFARKITKERGLIFLAVSQQMPHC
ncbi:MAG: radical SAM protein [Prevotella sp.]|nr:radical SAM protein [Prevotella sp.]MCM1075401.1 radical SAM protein [Ruminococcus sp.]